MKAARKQVFFTNFHPLGFSRGCQTVRRGFTDSFTFHLQREFPHNAVRHQPNSRDVCQQIIKANTLAWLVLDFLLSNAELHLQIILQMMESSDLMHEKCI